MTLDTKTSQMGLSIWKSKVKVTLSDDNKGYHVHGDERIPKDVVLPRVTGILNIIEKQGLRTWAMNMALDNIKENLSYLSSKRIELTDDGIDDLIERARLAHEEKRDIAADYGTEAHALLQQLCIDPDTAVPDKFVPVVSAWEEWLDNSGLTILDTETSLYYHDTTSKDAPISFAGTADLIAMDKDGTPVICDYKTGARLYPESALQMAAYSLGLAYCGIGKFLDAGNMVNTKAFVIRLPKEEGTLPEIREVRNLDDQRLAFINACKLRQWQSSRDKWVPKRKKA